jgi:small subunit ribosomal protein S8
MSFDSIGDFLTVIRNGLMVSKRFVTVPNSKFRVAISAVLKDEGYIKDFNVEKIDGKLAIKIFLKYVKGESVIHEIKRISKPSRRCYERLSKLTQVIGGLGTSILTTSSGIMTDRSARRLKIGGEVVCHVW